MPTNSTYQLGRLIANGINATNSLLETTIPDDLSQSLLLSPKDKIILNIDVELNSYTYPTNSFIIDHPVYGDIDSSTLLIDGGYDEGIMVIYEFNTTEQDSLPYRNNCTYYNITEDSVNAKIGSKCVSFNGTNSRIDMFAAASRLTTLNEGSIVLWYNTTDASSNGCLFSLKTGTTNERGFLSFYSSGSNEIKWSVRNAGSWNEIFSNDSSPENEWVFLVITSDGITTKMYVNGVLQSDTGNGDWFNDVTTINAIELGRRVYTTDQWYAGLMDEVIFYDRALSQSEIDWLYNNGDGRSYPKLIGTRVASYSS